jgi:16S rRNA (cytidine1402-2'-O)-methyltransferase
MAKLIVIPTPIGNLGDITLRAIKALSEVEVIMCEDTRTTGNLMRHLNISKPLIAYHLNNEHKALQRFIEKIESCELVGLTSDAGTPGISDPGFLIIRECIRLGIEVECLPGPTALIPAIVASGLPCDKFLFYGFLPHKKGRQTAFKELSQLEYTIVFYESPHRLVKTLEQSIEFFGGERRACVVREISKIYETYKRETLEDLLQFYQNQTVKGEIVLVIEGINEKKVKAIALD